MRRYLLVGTGMLAILLLMFLAVEAAGVPVLTDPSPWLSAGTVAAAALGVALLVVDVALPVPSSVVMLAHGAVFGVAAGTVLSTVGAVGAAVVAFWIGRRGGPLLDRLVTAVDRERADRMVGRWGVFAVAVSRPVPLLAETVGMLAGTTSMPWPRFVLAAVAGSLPLAVVYGVTGAWAQAFLDGAAVFLVVVVVATLAWWLVRRADARVGSEP
jgi:uncharacterized membrane protein YdjX (TVP38/TMEM64 family)